jgi:hypothetical protein
MEGVTTAIVLFIFVAICFPRLIDNRPQYYAALACALLIILLDGLARIFNNTDFSRFAYMGTAILQFAAILLLFLSAGGLTTRGLTKEMAGAFEVIRRGEKEKELIIPIGNQGKEPRKRAVDTAGEPQRYDISAEEAAAASYPPKSKPSRKEEEGPISMD